MPQCAKLQFEYQNQRHIAYLQSMGKKEIKQSKNGPKAGHKAIRRTFTPPIIQQFDENEPLGLAKTFRVQRQEVEAMFQGPQNIAELRREEANLIKDFINEVSSQNMRGCKFLMISGNTDLGKSLCVADVLKGRRQKIVKINTEMVQSFGQAQNIICEQIIGQRIASSIPTHRIISECVRMKLTDTVIVLIDSISVLFNGYISDSDNSTQFLSLFSAKQLNIALIGVGGTMTDFKRYAQKVRSLKQPFKTIIFEAYSKQEIAYLIKEKLKYIHSKLYFKFRMANNLIELAAAKMIAITSNLKIMMTYLKKILMIKLENFEARLPIYPQQDDHEDWVFTIEADDLQAIKKVEASKGSLACSLPIVQQIILVGLSKTFNKEELLYISQERAFMEIKGYLKDSNISYNIELIKVALKEIQNYGLIKVQRKGHQTRIMLMVASEDLKWCQIQETQDSLRVLDARISDGALQMIDNLC